MVAVGGTGGGNHERPREANRDHWRQQETKGKQIADSRPTYPRGPEAGEAQIREQPRGDHGRPESGKARIGNKLGETTGDQQAAKRALGNKLGESLGDRGTPQETAQKYQKYVFLHVFKQPASFVSTSMLKCP